MMWSHGMSWAAWALMVGWWTLVAVGIAWLLRSVLGDRDARPSARQVLDERFAAGELSVEEYQERRRALR